MTGRGDLRFSSISVEKPSFWLLAYYDIAEYRSVIVILTPCKSVRGYKVCKLSSTGKCSCQGISFQHQILSVGKSPFSNTGISILRHLTRKTCNSSVNKASDILQWKFGANDVQLQSFRPTRGVFQRLFSYIYFLILECGLLRNLAK